MIASSVPEADAAALLQQQFMDHTSSATEEDLAAAEADASNASGFMTNTLVTRGIASAGRARAATALPGGYAGEMDRLAALRVATAESGDLRDPMVSNLPVGGSEQRHATTNEPPLPEVPANMVRGQIGASGVVQDRARDAKSLLAAKNVDVHRVLNSFHPDGMRLREYDWNEGGPLGTHQGLGVRFDTQSKYNRYGRQVLPRDVPKKEPLPMVYDPRQERAGPYNSGVAAAERDLVVPHIRDSQHADLSSFDYDGMRGPVKAGGVYAMDSRPDMIVHPSRRDNPESHLTRLEMPYIPRSRAHALVAQEQALAAQQQLLDDGF